MATVPLFGEQAVPVDHGDGKVDELAVVGAGVLAKELEGPPQTAL
jgi:hypothetical protein